MTSCGVVYLVGAGPGDPSLITLRACQCLARADFVLYDYLVNPQILEQASPQAELVCLGRHGQGRIMPQEEINRRLIDEARRGRRVVRLKGGDPAVFARTAEETAALREAGIPFEIVPGITAALAAGNYAGISITDRELASGIALLTGQESAEKQQPGLDYEALARFPGTLVYYMGVTSAPLWSQALIDAGKPASTPAALVRRATWPDQQTIRCTLGEIPQVLASRKIRPPVVAIVGEVVSGMQPDAWFATRPLFGQTVLVTRPQEQAFDLRNRLSELGAEVLVQPAIEIAPPSDWAPVDEAINRLQQYDWLVFSSANGVRYFLQRIESLGYDLRLLAKAKIAAIGPATTRALSQYHLRADLQPDEYRAEALADALRSEAVGKRFLLLRASRGREVLAETLAQCGAVVEQVVVYSSTDVLEANSQIAERMRAGTIAWTTVTSSAIARSLVQLFPDALHKTRLVTISPLTSEVLRGLGYQPAAEAGQYTTEGVIDAIVHAAVKNSSKSAGSIDRQ